MPEAFEVPIESLLFPPPVQAGLNEVRLLDLTDTMRGLDGHPYDPVELARSPGGLWRIVDGRHRVIAAMAAGRPRVLAVELVEPDAFR